jgi:hypothetical protein
MRRTRLRPFPRPGTRDSRTRYPPGVGQDLEDRATDRLKGRPLRFVQHPQVLVHFRSRHVPSVEPKAATVNACCWTSAKGQEDIPSVCAAPAGRTGPTLAPLPARCGAVVAHFVASPKFLVQFTARFGSPFGTGVDRTIVQTRATWVSCGNCLRLLSHLLRIFSNPAAQLVAIEKDAVDSHRPGNRNRFGGELRACYVEGAGRTKLASRSWSRCCSQELAISPRRALQLFATGRSTYSSASTLANRCWQSNGKNSRKYEGRHPIFVSCFSFVDTTVVVR